MHSKDKGVIGELKVALDLVKQGYSVFREMGDNSKIDILAVDESYNLFKIQVKYVTPQNGVVKITTKKCGPNSRFNYKPEHADVYAIYVPENDCVLYISAKEFLKCKNFFSIRLEPTKSKQIKKIRMWTDYLSFAKAINC